MDTQPNTEGPLCQVCWIELSALNVADEDSTICQHCYDNGGTTCDPEDVEGDPTECDICGDALTEDNVAAEHNSLCEDCWEREWTTR